MKSQRFKCARCGKCCKLPIFLTPKEASIIGEFLLKNDKIRSVTAKNLNTTEKNLFSKLWGDPKIPEKFDFKINKTDEFCPFLEGKNQPIKTCLIYPVRPVICISYPEDGLCINGIKGTPFWNEEPKIYDQIRRHFFNLLEMILKIKKKIKLFTSSF